MPPPSDREWKNPIVEFVMTSLKNFLKNTSVSLSFIVYLYKNFSSKIFSLRHHHRKNALEGRRAAYFLRTLIPQHPPPRNSLESKFCAFTDMFKVDQPPNFLFLTKIGGKMATKTKGSKNKLYKKLGIIYNMLF